MEPENGNSPILTGGTSAQQVFDIVEKYNLDSGLKSLKYIFWKVDWFIDLS